MVALAHTDGEEVSAPALKFINRLSDFLFVAARHANDDRPCATCFGCRARTVDPPKRLRDRCKRQLTTTYD